MFLKIVQLSILLLPIQAFGENQNPIIGNWRWSSKDCTSVDLIFKKNSITHNGDADGELAVDTFKNPKYTIGNKFITVDFGQLHGFGGSQNRNQLNFKVIDQDHMVIDRKEGLNDIYRCK